ncbi:MAG: ATPase, T2SS/T4P/T4SS family, partial [Hadesarchaea archaeon]|nr:ATPase, T2SS/T4P/T4SS family [Hadesarchaea archaeon]
PAKKPRAARVKKRLPSRKRRPPIGKPRAKKGTRVVKKPIPVKKKVKSIEKTAVAKRVRPPALKPIEGPPLEAVARPAAPKTEPRPLAKATRPSKRLAEGAAPTPATKATEKLPLQIIASDSALEELKQKLEAKREVEALKEFEEYTTFELPKGYKELERYWIVKPYAWAAILFNEEKNERLYYLVEPTLTPLEKTILETLHEHLLDRLTYEAGKERDAVIREKALELLDEYGLSLEEKSVNKIIYYLRRNYVGYGRIDGLLRDPRIEDISCDGVDVPIFLYHRDHQNIRTNIVFEDAQELDLFVIRLVERAGRQISLGRPTVDAALPEGYRLQATIGTEITTRGSSFSIRKYTEEPFTPVDLILHGTFSPEMLAYLWLATENKRNIMVVGGTASGKTCTLNALSLFIPPDAKIISIEDTRELTLYQDNWLASVTRDAHGEKAIDMYDLLRQALRQRPEVIIVGEVRGKEALTLFQAMSTGHSCYSTMHAGSIQEMVHRLEGEPINVPHHMLTALDIVCLQLLTYHRDRRVRRNQSIVEVLGVDPVSGALRTNRIYERNPITDEFERVGNSQVLLEIAYERGWSAVELERELENRKKVLEYLARNNMRRIGEVSAIIRQYYFDPAKVMELVERGGR